jgi:uncharacterized protein YndB with AHSA1/START domain
MTTVERSIFINATPDEINAISLVPERMPEWYAGIEHAVSDDVFPEAGGMAEMVYKAAGIKFDMTMTVIEYVPGEYITYQMGGMITGVTTWATTPEGGGTQLSAIFEYEMPGGGVGKVVDRLVVERMNTDNLEKSLHNLKALVEGG